MEKLIDLSLEDAFYREAAIIIMADLDGDCLEKYALVSAAIRYRIKGITPLAIAEALEELRAAVKIEIL